VQDWQKAAQSAVQQKNHNAAVSIYAQIIQAYPQTQYAIEAHRETAALFIQTGRIQDAENRVQLLKTEFSTHPDAAESLYWVARHYEWNGWRDSAVQLHQYNASTYSSYEKGMWSQVEIVYDHIRRKDWAGAQTAYADLLTRFSQQPTLAKEIWQISRAYADAGRADTAWDLCRYCAAAFPETEFGAIAQGEIVVNRIKQGYFSAADAEYERLLVNFGQTPMLPRELYRIAGEYAKIGQIDTSSVLHRYNAQCFGDNVFGLWSNVEVVFNAIRQKDFASAQMEYLAFLMRYADDPSLPKEIYNFGQEFIKSGNSGNGISLHKYNADVFPNTEYGLLSQGEVIIDCIRNKDFLAAEAECAKMLINFEKEPMLAREVYHIAGVYAKAGQPEKALALYQYNSTLYGDHDFGRWSHVETVLALIRKKNFPEARETWKTFAARYEKEPTLSKELYMFGREFGDKGCRDLGFEVHRYNADHCGNTEHGRWSAVETAFYYIDQEDFDNASAACLDFIQRYPDHPDLGKELQNMLNRYVAKGHFAPAEAFGKLALETYPDNSKMIWIQGGLIQLYLDQIAENEAATAFEKLITAGTENPELYQVVKSLGRHCSEKGDSGMALQLFNRFLSQHAESPDAFDIEIERINTYIDLAAAENAGTAIRDFLEKYPDMPGRTQIINGFANRCRDVKMHRKAIELYQTVLSQEPPADEKMEALGNMAKSAVHLEEVADAPDVSAVIQLLMTDFKDAKRLGFHVYQIGEEYYFRGKAYTKGGQRDKAAYYFNKAFNIWEKNLNDIPDVHHQCLAYYTIGLSYYYMGDYVLTADALKMAYQIDPQFKYADYCLFENVRCYGRLALTGQMNRCEAFYNSILFYDELLEKFPDSKYCSQAKLWLSQCMEEQGAK
jgi:tetratricopeptide (TPR) repeat protein